MEEYEIAEIVENGKGEKIILTKEVVTDLDKAEEDYREGRYRNAREVWEELSKKYKFDL